MPGIAVVTNPRSRQNRKNPRIAGQLAYMLGERGEVAQPQTISGSITTARRFRDRNIDVLAINGGDGTTHVVLSAFAEAYGDAPLPPVALLRGGTMNTVATGLGIKGKPAALLASLVDRYHQGDPPSMAERHLLKVAGETPRYGFLFGNGVVSNFLEVYYEGSEPTPLKAAWLVGKAIASLIVKGPLGKRLTRPVDVEVQHDGGVMPPRSFMTVTAGTVEDMGLRFRPFLEVPRHPGYMQALGIACPPLDIAWQVVRMRLGLPPDSPDIHSVITRKLVLRSETPIAYMIDGDFHQGGRELEVSIGPRVRLILPDPEV